MKNYDSKGEHLTVPAPTGGAVSGSAYLIGGLVVVADDTQACGTPCSFLTRGVVVLPRNSGQVWTALMKVYWDDTAKLFVTSSTGNTLVGVAAEAVPTGPGTGKVRLDGVTR